jgi:opacity protein-like surface antigen
MMRGLLKNFVVAAAFAAALAPKPAQADGFFSPWAGINFANKPADGRASFGFSAGGMAGGVLGAEFDLGYSPSFFGTENAFGSNNLLTVMGNVIIGLPFGGSSGPGVRPYVTGGLGLVRARADILAVDASNTDLAMDFGGGVMGYFSDHFGLRGDLRYFRSSLDLDFLNTDNVDFWRASVGIVLR